MPFLRLLVIHLAALACSIWLAGYDAENARAFIYAFLLSYCVECCLIAGMTRAAKKPGSAARFWVEAFSHPPAPGQASYPVTAGGPGGPPTGLGPYLLIMGFLFGLAFVLMNVGPDKELHLDRARQMQDAKWAAMLTALFVAQTVVTSKLVVDVNAPVPKNLGYNTRDMTVMALAVLAAGMTVAYRQAHGLSPSGWVVLGPALGFRLMYDVAEAWQRTRLPHGGAAA